MAYVFKPRKKLKMKGLKEPSLVHPYINLMTMIEQIFGVVKL